MTIHVQPSTRPQRSTQLGSARQRPVKTSVNQETATAHPAWCEQYDAVHGEFSDPPWTRPVESPVYFCGADQLGKLDRECRDHRNRRDQSGLQNQSPSARSMAVQPRHKKCAGPSRQAR